MRFVVIGGAGFIGSHFAELLTKKTEVEKILVIDLLTYAGKLENLEKASQSKKYSFMKWDINQIDEIKNEIENYDVMVNFAAESHVDNSIKNPKPFFYTNGIGVASAVQIAMDLNYERFIQVSTDEVYGPVALGEMSENSPVNPSSPYSASKLGGEFFAISYWKTYKFPVLVTRGCNTYGPRQYPEKLIPLAKKQLDNNKKIPIYGSGNQIREWIHVKDHAEAIWQVSTLGKPGEIYNVGSGERFTNLEIIGEVIKAYNKSLRESVEYVEDRKGHDFRYAINSEKIKSTCDWQINYDVISELKKIKYWI